MKITGYLLLLLGIILYLFPEIDLAISSLFFEEGEGFYLNNEPIFKAIYKSVNILVPLITVAIVGGYIYQLFRKKAFQKFNKRALVYLFLVFSIGSGIVVNLGLKESFGRARPMEIIQFGGNKEFSPAAVINDKYINQCASFSCGHCSFALGFIAFYFLFRKSWVLVLTLGYGLLVSFGRVAQGGHFFSDFIFSFIVMFFSAKIIYYYMYERKRD
ncbi:phosphatase PAP2 family protein [bacterium]|nr:phosphatase PAP2 family protein [bacterium]MBU1959534.1 phosphatase PAP2 family protein [bacterium]